MEYKKEVVKQGNDILQQNKQLVEQIAKIIKQEETIQQLNDKLYEQNKRNDSLLQLQFENSQFQV